MQGIEIPIGANLDQLKAAQKEIKDRLNKIKNDGESLGQGLGNGLAKGSNQAAFALQNLGRVVQDAPFGFIGIQNNLNPLLESFQQLKKDSVSTQGALKALVGSLVGAGGIGLALSAVTAAFTFAQMGLRSWGIASNDAASKTKEVTKSFKEQKDEFIKSPYEDAVIELNELTNQISLAKQGFIDKKSVLKLYNDSIGATIGQVTNLDEAEQKLVANGDKYLQLMLLKAKAEFAFKKAAEQSFEIQKKQSEIEVNKNPLGLDKKALQELNQLRKQPPTALELQTKFDQEKEIKVLETYFNRAKDIAKNAQQEVVDFAKESGFNLDKLFNKKISDSGEKLKTLEQILADLSTQFKVIDNQIKGTFGDQNKERINALNDAIKELVKIKAPQSEIAKLQEQILALDQSAFERKGLTLGVNLIQGIQKGASQSGIGGQIGVDITQDMAEGFNRGLPVIAQNFSTKLKTGLTDWQMYVNDTLLPQLQRNFETFFNDILMRGKLSFESLGKAIVNTFLSALASDAAKELTNLFKISQGKDATESKKDGTGLLKGIASLFASKGAAAAVGGKAAAVGATTAAAGGTTAALGTATVASGGALLPILAGVAAVATIASLIKKKKPQAPVPMSSQTISTSAAQSFQDFGGGRVVFEISGTNLIGVLNRAGAKLQRFGP